MAGFALASGKTCSTALNMQAAKRIFGDDAGEPLLPVSGCSVATTKQPSPT